jgi:hypothetical protein
VTAAEEAPAVATPSLAAVAAVVDATEAVVEAAAAVTAAEEAPAVATPSLAAVAAVVDATEAVVEAAAAVVTAPIRAATLI